MRSVPAPLRAGVIATALVIVTMLVAPLLVGRDPVRTELAGRLERPSLAHPLGCDGLGRDVLARIAAGARVSLGVAAATVVTSLAIGTVLGATGGLAGGFADVLVGRAVDVVLAFPGLLLAIALAAVRGPGIANVVVALVAVGWPAYARLARTHVMALRGREFAQASIALGAGPAHVLGRHLLPLAAPTLLVQATFGFAGAILAEASLSFLGLGVPPPTPSWGSMLDEGRQFLLVAPHLVVFPAVALAGTVLALQLLGDGLRDWLDVRAGREPG